MTQAPRRPGRWSIGCPTGTPCPRRRSVLYVHGEALAFAAALGLDPQSDRIKSDPLFPTLYGQFEEHDRKVVDEVRAIAEERGVSRAQVALAWLYTHPAIASPIIGAT
jgi:aryl-alcohol dehydrogenase-like predicted oxidoreductase